MDTSYRGRRINNPLLKLGLLEHEDPSIDPERISRDNNRVGKGPLKPPRVPGTAGHSISIVSPSLPPLTLDENKKQEDFTAQSGASSSTSLQSSKIKSSPTSTRSTLTSHQSDKTTSVAPENSKSPLSEGDVFSKQNEARLFQQDKNDRQHLKNQVAIEILRREVDGGKGYSPPKF